MQGGSLLLAERENVAAANKRQWMEWWVTSRPERGKRRTRSPKISGVRAPSTSRAKLGASKGDGCLRAFVLPQATTNLRGGAQAQAKAGLIAETKIRQLVASIEHGQ